MSRTRHLLSSFALIAGLAAGLGPRPAAADGAAWMRPKSDYMAHTVMEADGARLTGRVWASGEKERRELAVSGRTHDVILRRDLGVAWILMPEQRMYLEQPLGEHDRMASGDLVREAVGKESVNGVETTRYRIHGTAGDGRPFEGTMWMTEQDIPVRVVTGEGPERVRIELEGLSLGFVAPGRFEIPRGWSRFELPDSAKADLDAMRRR
ncbi:MAG TPA: hypothetical protein VKB65_03680 [Myxococcota bacterium]|nr:hypothetical protein [Myxococcota bacterium]